MKTKIVSTYLFNISGVIKSFKLNDLVSSIFIVISEKNSTKLNFKY